MRGRALTNDVSISELMHMRGEGMSNSQIAESLGVSTSTIYAAIGKGGPRRKRVDMRERVARADAQYERARCEITPEPQEQSPLALIISRRWTIQGERGLYEVEIGDERRIAIQCNDMRMEMALDDAAGMAQELTRIVERYKSFRNELEVL